jgi:hypothetical protein
MSQIMSPKATRVPIAIEVRCLRVPTRWVLRQFERHELGVPAELNSGEWKLVPEVEQGFERRCTPIEDPWEVRDQFFRMKHTEGAALEFLNLIGVWQTAANTLTTIKETLLNGAFGLREFYGRALPLTLETLWRDQAHWMALLKNPSLLHAEFGMPPREDAIPAEKSIFASKARVQNTLPIHVEWSKGSKRVPPSAHAVIQPITGRELLIATAQIELLSGTERQFCQRLDCGPDSTSGGIPFSGRRRKYCCENCAHVEAVRASRAREKRRKEHGKKR